MKKIKLITIFLSVLIFNLAIMLYCECIYNGISAREPSACNSWGICVYPDGAQICCFPEGSLKGCANGCCDCIGPFV
ncbi:hypothetical protein [Candidatus Kryptobacter tengchongensis]|uniref:hypothetical protein n=1 Tax=Kryptobacter tengchongensis TaxID=1643429 RepID=UPI0007083833|nr:hypothetical protein [Candidatus Kryptobacter tengchongensis]CUS92545.1 hypothetical protein JGI20_01502 [Candidatus Kryptobacter tengchongensis]